MRTLPAPLTRIKPIPDSSRLDCNVPRKAEALTGVQVLWWTLANHDGTTFDRPMTHMYLACPSIATISDVSIPKLAPAPITFDTHFQPLDCPLNAAENGASGSICAAHCTKGQFSHFNIPRPQPDFTTSAARPH